MTAPTRNRLALKANQPFESVSTRTVLNETQKGRLNCLGQVTLNANAATTTISSDSLISINSRLFFTPRTANGAAALSGLYQDDPVGGAIVLHHANDANTDKTLDYAVIG